MRISLEGYSPQPLSLGGKKSLWESLSNHLQTLQSFCFEKSQEPWAGSCCQAAEGDDGHSGLEQSTTGLLRHRTGVYPTQHPKPCPDSSTLKLPYRPGGTAHSQRPLYTRTGGSWLVPSVSIPTPPSLATPAPRDRILVHSYLSHSCLHNLQAQLVLQLSLHLFCGQGGDGQACFPSTQKPPQKHSQGRAPTAAHQLPSSAEGHMVGALSSWSLGRGIPQLGGEERNKIRGTLLDSPVWLATSASEKFWGFCRMRKVSAGPTTLPGRRGTQGEIWKCRIPTHPHHSPVPPTARAEAAAPHGTSSLT